MRDNINLAPPGIEPLIKALKVNAFSHMPRMCLVKREYIKIYIYDKKIW